MPQTRSRIFDDLSRLMTDAAGLADGARREVDTVLRSQLERLLSGMDFVSREEFEAVREMAANARQENDRLQTRIAALEARLGAVNSPQPTP
jgi:BMFP domain-containing protein YqiC